jgi:ubiquinone/menaquinone biosynthesis C-methylase UbiE
MAKLDQYIPAFNYHWLTPLYDPFMKWDMHDRSFKSQLIQRAQIQPGMRVLDLGYGHPPFDYREQKTHHA